MAFLWRDGSAENRCMARKKSSIGCLFWVALILLVLVIFLFNRNTIETVLDRTGLMDQIARQREPSAELSVDVEVNSEPIEAVPTAGQSELEESARGSDPTPATIVVEEQGRSQSETDTESDPEAKQEIALETFVRRATLYFVNIDGENSISLTGVVRPVSFVDSPLTVTIETLLQGLSSTEIGRGLLSLVPEGTSLNGVAVRGNTAYVDFNESFRFNTFGREGYRFQLQQIVFTATEYQSVENVQILVEGEKLSYLGPESPFVGEPLSRDSFAS